MKRRVNANGSQSISYSWQEIQAMVKQPEVNAMTHPAVEKKIAEIATSGGHCVGAIAAAREAGAREALLWASELVCPECGRTRDKHGIPGFSGNPPCVRDDLGWWDDELVTRAEFLRRKEEK